MPADEQALVGRQLRLVACSTSPQNGRMPSPTLLYQLYREEFDGAYNEGTMFILTLHPFLSGHRAPMQHLDDFVAYMQSKPGVWFATCEQIARYVKDAAGSGVSR